MDGLSKSQNDPADERSPPRRISIRGVALAGAGAAAMIGVIWVSRLPLGAFILTQQLSAPGAPASLQLSRLDFGGLTLANLRAGPPAAPDITAKMLAIDFGWSPGFRVEAVRLDDALIRVRIDEKGVSLGVLDKFLKGGVQSGAAKPASIPDLALAVHNTTTLIETPLGALTAIAEGSGALRHDFTGKIDIAPRDVQGAAGGIEALEAHLILRTAGGRIGANLTGAAETIAWRKGDQAIELSNAQIKLAVTAPVSLGDAHVEARIGAADAQIAGNAFTGASLETQIDAGALDAGFVPKTWSGTLRAALASAKGANIDAGAITTDATVHGDNARLTGNYIAKLGRGGAFGFSAPGTVLDGPFSGDFSRSPITFTAQGDLAAPSASVDAHTRKAIIDAAPGLGGTPMGPLMDGAKHGLDRALTRFALNAPFSFTWANDKGRLSASGAGALTASSGARISIAPLSGAGPSARIGLPGGQIEGGASIEIAGGGLPQATITIADLQTRKDEFTLNGRAEIAAWQAGDSAARSKALDFDVKTKNGAGDAHIRGNVKITGPLAGMRLVDAQTPLNLTAHWKDGFRVTPADGMCQEIRTARIEAAGLIFDKAILPLCPADGGFFAASDKQGNYSGGFYINALTLSGRMNGGPLRPATLSIGGINSQLGGAAARMRLDTTVSAPSLLINWDAARTVSVRGKSVTANLLAADSWRVTGALSDIRVEDSTAPARVEAFNGALIVELKGDDAVLRIANGAGRVFDWHDKRLVQPMTLRGVEVRMENGVITGHGDIRLEKPDTALGQFTLTHNLASGKGDAAATARGLRFSPVLQPYYISETMLSVVANVSGPLDADFGAHWSGDSFTTDAKFSFENMNMATTALGPVDGVSGTVVFNDFATLSTPPGQRITVAKINPGIEVKDGLFHFQMKPNLNVALESAIWPFAGGRLSVLPTTFDLNSKEMRFTLDLADVDVNELVKQLNVKDLSATGTVEGSFPLVFKSGKGRIENGQLLAALGGGTIQYSSDFGQTGVAQLAFDALRSFHYDNLTLALNGDLDDEVLTSIAFSGVNRDPVKQSAGPGAVKLVGIPFKFNVQVRAPFMALSRAAATVTDARGLLNPTESSVDVTAPPQPTENKLK